MDVVMNIETEKTDIGAVSKMLAFWECIQFGSF